MIVLANAVKKKKSYLFQGKLDSAMCFINQCNYVVEFFFFFENELCG